MSYSCNNNQNHLVKNGRSTSRVLQPPGGASSLSLGGYGGGASDYPVRRDNNRNGNGNNSSTKSYGYGDDGRPPPMPNRVDRRDSLDQFIGESECNIPGLQTHYKGKTVSRNDSGSGMDNSYSRNSRPNGTLSGADYAAQLKAQINTKHDLVQRGIERNDSFGSSSRNNQYQRNSYDDNNNNIRGRRDDEENLQRRSPQLSAGSSQQLAQTSTRCRNPPGGNSSFSIGWN